MKRLTSLVSLSTLDQPNFARKIQTKIGCIFPVPIFSLKNSKLIDDGVKRLHGKFGPTVLAPARINQNLIWYTQSSFAHFHRPHGFHKQIYQITIYFLQLHISTALKQQQNNDSSDVSRAIIWCQVWTPIESSDRSFLARVFLFLFFLSIFNPL